MRTSLFRFLYNIGVAKLLRIYKHDKITVLNIHRISNERDEFYNPIKPETFKKIIEYCTKHYTITTFSELHDLTPKPKLILSFDDGYYDFIATAIPILQQFGIPANHNIVNKCVNTGEPIWTEKLNKIFHCLKKKNITNEPIILKDIRFEKQWDKYYMSYFNFLLTLDANKRNLILRNLCEKYNVVLKTKMMNWDDVIYCSNHDVEIGSHTYNHNSLKQEHNLNFLKKEIKDSIQEIEKQILKKVSILALPNGQYNQTVLDFSKSLDIKFILKANDKLNNESQLASTFNEVNRVGLSDISSYENFLKIEMFHTRMKKNKII